MIAHGMITMALTAVLAFQGAKPPPGQPATPPPATPTTPATPATPGTPAIPTTPAGPTTPQGIATPRPPKSNPFILWDSPRAYDVNFDVSIHSLAVKNPGKPLVMPIIPQGTSSYINLETVSAQVQFKGTVLDNGRGSEILTGKGLFSEYLIEAPTTGITPDPKLLNLQTQILFQTYQQVICYSSKVDDAALASIPWPSTWPADVAAELEPQALIQSDKSFFTNAVKNVSGGNLRMVSPWVAAKELVRYSCNNIQKQGSSILRGPNNSIRGLEVNGALAAANAGRGTPSDLVCVCVAMLRAAGIPARPVIGIGKNDKDRNDFLIWAELYLPDAGWIPFNPDELRGKGIRSWNVNSAWREFGTMKDLNRMIPLAYAFAPDHGDTAYDCWAIWGWSRMTLPEFPVPIELWRSRLGDKEIILPAWNTPSVINFRIASKGAVRTP